MKVVIIESPYAGDVEANIEYARKCMKHSLSLGEAPLASHLLYTQEGVLDDTIEEERKQGIEAGFAWAKLAKKHVFYIDKGMSKGMEEALKYAIENEHIVEFRRLAKPIFTSEDGREMHAGDTMNILSTTTGAYTDSHINSSLKSHPFKGVNGQGFKYFYSLKI